MDVSSSREKPMQLVPVSRSCFAIVSQGNQLCCSNSGFISGPDGGLVIDTQSDLSHARKLKQLIDTLDAAPPRYVVNTHEDLDHVGGNQLFADCQIVAHRSVAQRMPQVADPRPVRNLTRAVGWPIVSALIKHRHPGLYEVGKQLRHQFDFSKLRLTPPTVLFDERFEISLGKSRAELTHLGPAHQCGDAIVHFPSEGVVFTGDLLFSTVTPIGWSGTHQNWVAAINRIQQLEPKVLVPGHGPPCGPAALSQMLAWLQLLWERSESYFERGCSAVQAASEIDLRSFAEWSCPARLYITVERNFRELRRQPCDDTWNLPATFDAVHQVAKARGLRAEY